MLDGVGEVIVGSDIALVTVGYGEEINVYRPLRVFDFVSFLAKEPLLAVQRKPFHFWIFTVFHRPPFVIKIEIAGRGTRLESRRPDGEGAAFFARPENVISLGRKWSLPQGRF